MENSEEKKRFEVIENEIIDNLTNKPFVPDTAVNCINEVKSNPDPPSCHVCGAMMMPSGYKCLSCGTTTKVTGPIEGFVAAKPLDGKYGITSQLKIVNLVSGQEIPEDEPLFLLRARDKFAIATLMYYLITCKKECNELHLEGIKQVIDKFKKFADECNERMKQPLTDEIIAAYYQEWRAKYDFSVAHIALVGTPPELPPRWVVDCIQFCLKKGTS